MLDLVTWVRQKFASSHISFSFLGMWSFIHLWYVLKMAVRAKGNYLSGKLQSCAGLGQFSGKEDGDRGGLFICQTWLLPLSGPLLKSQAFESLMAM